MQPFWPTREEFFGLPRRVSRIFVILFIFSATLNALLIIAYGYLQISHNIVAAKEKSTIASVLSQSARYKSERDDAQATAVEKSAELDKVTKELADTTSKLDAANAQLASLNSQIKTQEAQLAANSAELDSLRSRPPLFSFQKNTSRDVTQDETDAKEIVTAAFDTVSNIYGQPYILHQITISFVDSLSISGANGEITISNSSNGLSITIKLTSFDKNDFEDVNTLVHEMIHGFHGLAALNSPILEEGITVAATDVVLDQLYSQGKISFEQNYITISDEQAALLNSGLANPPGDSSLYSSSKVVSYYQLAGWSWRQLYENNHSFFSQFNNLLYNHTIKGETPNTDLVKSLISQTMSNINGQSISSYLSDQISFNPV